MPNERLSAHVACQTVLVKRPIVTYDNCRYIQFMAPAQLVLMSDAVSDESPDSVVIRQWLHGRSAATLRAYLESVGVFQAFVGRPLASVTLADLQAFADSLAGSASSKRRHLAAVKSLLTFASRCQLIPFNVGAALRMPAVKNTVAERMIDHSDVLMMIRLETDGRDACMLLFLYQTGCRVSELCGLKWRDVTARGDRAQVTLFGKGGKTRHVLVSVALCERMQALRGARCADDAVFHSRTGKALTSNVVWGVVSSAARRVGLENVSPHWLRHSCASNALEHGANIALVKEQLGHSSLTTTSVYTHARPDTGLYQFLPGMKDARQRAAKVTMGSLGQTLVSLGAEPTDALARLQAAGIEPSAEFTEDLLRRALSR